MRTALTGAGIAAIIDGVRALTLALFLPAAASPAQVQPVPLPELHAHNDYYHRRPLLDALDAGAMSVEIDVFAIEGDLLVAHDRVLAKPSFTLRGAYLEPLRERIRRNGGRVYRGGELEFQLLVDFKSAAAPTHRELVRQLQPYRDLLTRFGPGARRPGPLMVVVSGNRPAKRIAAAAPRWCAIDGRIAELDAGRGPDLEPLVSARWGSHFGWNGVGAMPDDERRLLGELVERAHRRGRKIRFWGVPNNSGVWQQQLEAGVDWLNVDRLDLARDYLLEQWHPARIPLASLPPEAAPPPESAVAMRPPDAIPAANAHARIASLMAASFVGTEVVRLCVHARVDDGALWLLPSPRLLRRVADATRRHGVRFEPRVFGEIGAGRRWLATLPQ